MTSYPEDEFDRITPTGRRGAHRREAEASPRGAYAIIAVVAIVAVLLVVGVVNIIRTSFGDPEAGVGEPPAATDTAEPGDAPSEAPTDDTVAVVDKEGVVVAVLNSSPTSGAAATFAEATEANGWSVDEVGNYESTETTSTVFYSTADYEGQAGALAEELGVPDTEESTEFSADLTVVIASDIADSPPTGAATDGAAEEATEGTG